MVDNLKFRVDDLKIIGRLFDMLEQDFDYYKPDDKYYRSFYHSFKHKDFGVKFSLHFQKVFEKNTSGKKVLAGYGSVDIVISPHYHFNNYHHNGNDFTPKNCIKTIIDILTYLKIKPQEYDLLKVVNIEFGLNLIPETDIKTLIDLILFHNRTAFVVPIVKFPYSKTTDTETTNTKEKFIKAYAKGFQFADFPQYGIDENTFRFEVKHKKSRPTNTIFKKKKVTAIDLLNLENYKIFSQEIIKEWDFILLLNQTPDFSNLKTDEVEFIRSADKKEFWDYLNRLQFGRQKEKYYKILHGKNNLHTQIKGLIIDKLNLFQNDTFSPSETPINIEKRYIEETPPILIKGENVSHDQNNRVCLVTKLDISMQRKGSEYLCSAGLKYYKENDPNIYQEIELKYLTPKMRTRSIEDQIYYIAHNIRNTKTNPHHNFRNNRKRFEQRNYNTNQLQFNF